MGINSLLRIRSLGETVQANDAQALKPLVAAVISGEFPSVFFLLFCPNNDAVFSGSMRRFISL